MIGPELEPVEASRHRIAARLKRIEANGGTVGAAHATDAAAGENNLRKEVDGRRLCAHRRGILGES